MHRTLVLLSGEPSAHPLRPDPDYTVFPTLPIQTVWTKTTVELVVADGLAFEWYRYHVVDSPRDGGESAADTGNGVNIYRIDADGTWRVWRDIWATAS